MDATDTRPAGTRAATTLNELRIDIRSLWMRTFTCGGHVAAAIEEAKAMGDQESAAKWEARFAEVAELGRKLEGLL